MKKSKIRLLYLAGFLIMLFIEVIIALYVHDAFIRPYVGDMLVVVLVYFFVRIIKPEGIKHLPLYVFIFAAGVEILQYFQLVRLLGLESNTFLRIILGSIFDIKDIAAYGAGCLLLWAYERVMGSWRK